MKEMFEQDRRDNAGAHARKKRIARGVSRVIGLPAGSLCLLVLVAAIWTGCHPPIDPDSERNDTKQEVRTMIVDRIENAGLYMPLHKGFEKAFAVLAEPELIKKPDGRYDIDGNDVYYVVQRYTTRPVDPNKLESHKKYIDIQVVLAGEESLGYAPTAGLEVVTPYDEAKDIMFYRLPAAVTWTKLEPGRFCILYPQDGHMPGCQITSPAPVHKVVFKIRLDV
jgi:biofilm protein TabA